MSTSLSNDILNQLQGAPMQQMAQQLGLNPQQVSGAVSTALPLLLGTLGRNASQPEGAQALLGALSRDHAGSADNISGLIGAVLGGNTQSKQTNGAGILAHIFGNRQGNAAEAVGQTSGLGKDKAQTLLSMLAPIVLAYLAKQAFSNRPAGSAGNDGAGLQALGQILGKEQQAQQQSGVSSMLGRVFDQDGDGKFGMSDLMKIGMGALNKK